MIRTIEKSEGGKGGVRRKARLFKKKRSSEGKDAPNLNGEEKRNSVAVSKRKEGGKTVFLRSRRGGKNSASSYAKKGYISRFHKKQGSQLSSIGGKKREGEMSLRPRLPVQRGKNRSCQIPLRKKRRPQYVFR